MPDKLVLKAGKERREFELPLDPGTVSVGRSPENTILLDDPSVSRVHARLVRVEGRWTVADAGSRNGTLVNDVPLEPLRPVSLRDGDVVTFGTVPAELLRDERDRVVLTDEDAQRSSVTLTRPMTFNDLIGHRELPVGLPREAVEAVRRAHRAIRIATRVGEKLIGSHSLSDVMDAIVSLVFEATPAQRAALLVWDPHYKELIPKVIRTREGAGDEQLRVSRTVVDRAFQTRSVAWLEKSGDTQRSAVGLGIRSAVAVPLSEASGVTGVVYADCSERADAFDPFSVELLSALASYAAIAMEQARLQARLKREGMLRDKLSGYLAPEVVDRIVSLAGTEGVEMGAREAEASVLFCDMVGFTSRSEALEPNQVLALINGFFSRMTEVVFEHKGTVDKYIGDCLMAVFGAPLPQPDHARRAALAALALRDAIRELAQGDADLGFRIGLNSGRVVAGDVGSLRRRQWTVLGSAVNLASRVEAMAERDQILITEGTRRQLDGSFLVHSLGPRRPRGFSREIEVFELLGVAPSA